MDKETREERNAEVDNWVTKLDVVTMTQNEFESLLEYSTTLPTGKTIGKKWRRQLYFGSQGVRLSWLQGEYVEDPDPGFVGITWRRIEVEE